MAGSMGWHPDAYHHLTLREFCHYYDGFLLDRWDHTATIACLIHNLTGVVVSLVSKARPKPRSFEHFHPFREKKPRGLMIRKDNFHLLRDIGSAVLR